MMVDGMNMQSSLTLPPGMTYLTREEEANVTGGILVIVAVVVILLVAAAVGAVVGAVVYAVTH